MKNEYLAKAKSINATLLVTFKTPKIAAYLSDEPTRMSTKDTDFFEQEVLRQFMINVSRVVSFIFAAYPEDRDKKNNFVPLHYHAAVRSENDSKFKAIAEQKYRAALMCAYEKEFSHVVMPEKSIFIENICRDDPEKSYEAYMLKHYCPSKRLVTHDDFLRKKPLVA